MYNKKKMFSEELGTSHLMIYLRLLKNIINVNKAINNKILED